MRQFVGIWRVFGLGVVLSLALVPGAGAISFDIVDLGTLGGSSSFGYDVNILGQVTGIAENSGGADRAFWSDGTGLPGSMTDLGTLPGQVPEHTLSAGQGINDSGQVAGYSHYGQVEGVRAVIWDGGTIQNLGTLGGFRSLGRDINASGQVTGESNITGDATQHAFLWDGSTMHDLGTLGGPQSWGAAINDAGLVTGWSQFSTANATHAFLHNGLTMTDLGTLGGTGSDGQGINGVGHVTGSSDIAGDAARHMFLHDGTQMHDLGTLGGTFGAGFDLNDNGEVVGFSTTTAGALHAAYYDGQALFDLNDLITVPGWELMGATGINNVGQITGYGTIGGETHAFLLTPTPPVPEPAGILLMGLGIMGVRARYRGRK